MFIYMKNIYLYAYILSKVCRIIMEKLIFYFLYLIWVRFLFYKHQLMTQLKFKGRSLIIGISIEFCGFSFKEERF